MTINHAAPTPEAGAAAPDPLRRLRESHPLPSWRPLARVVMALVAAILAWACFARLDEVAIAEGEVVPEGKVKVIQHLEGGVVREIHVTDGDVVAEGTPLLQIELPVTALNRDELQVRLDGYILQRARLQAELSGEAISFPEAAARRRPQLAESERRTCETRRQALRAAISVLQDQARQRGLEVQEYESRQRSLATSLKLARERLEISRDLMTSGLASRMDHVQLEGQVEDLKGQLDAVRAAIPRAQAGQQEAKSRIEEEQSRYQRTVQGELGEAELNVARTTETLNQAADQQRRTVIASPIDGIVKNLRANTIGGVIRPGDPILEIVPLHERLQIEARLSPIDRGYVTVGQRATVKISAYDFTTYGGLDGTVVLVAADTTPPPDGNTAPFYRVLVQTDRAHLGDDQRKRAISPGMQASVEIHTGSRTVIDFLIKPVLRLRHDAFRER